MSNHTPEPWKISHDDSTEEWSIITNQHGSIIANVNEETGPELVGSAPVMRKMPGLENARRIVACVNACIGIRTEALEHRSHLLKAVDDDIAQLTAQRDELLAAMRQTLAMLRVTSHGPSAANKAEEMLHAAICSLGADHFPGAAKMVAHEGWQLVPVEPTPEMRLAGVASQSEKLKRYALGGSLPPIDHGIPDAYRAMLAAAPKREGGAS